MARNSVKGLDHRTERGLHHEELDRINIGLMYSRFESARSGFGNVVVMEDSFGFANTFTANLFMGRSLPGEFEERLDIIGSA
jgi:hypothetical protein